VISLLKTALSPEEGTLSQELCQERLERAAVNVKGRRITRKLKAELGCGLQSEPVPPEGEATNGTSGVRASTVLSRKALAPSRGARLHPRRA
jgi:hypothetical protein